MPDKFKAQKQIFECKIRKNKEIEKGVYKLILEVPFEIKQGLPGQFVNVYLKDRSMLLPRPISICRWDRGLVTLVYNVVGKGTEELASLIKGDFVKISSPNGNGFDLSAMEKAFEEVDDGNGKKKIVLLAGGGIGVPPLLQLAENIYEKKEKQGLDWKIISSLGFKNTPILEKEFLDCCDEVWVSTDSGRHGFQGNILDMIRDKEIKFDYCFSCGPTIMLKSLSEYCESKKVSGSDTGLPIQVSMEERMGCGYGACVGCTCQTELGQKKICSDGPVFMGSEVKWND